jgi:formate dehydrogenase subunit gamma
MATSPRRLARYGRTERAVHWVHATAFCILLGSGLCLYLPSLAEIVNRRPLLKSIHIYTALAWAIALVLVVILGDRRALRRTLREVEYLDADDRAWLRGGHTPQGRLNAGQKLNTVVTAAFAILFAISGFFLWYGERDTRFRFENTLLIHDWLMYLSFFLFVGHLYLALILPRTRHSMSGITRGWVREDWAARRHPKWVEAVRATENDPG